MSELRVPGAAPGMLPVGGNGWPSSFLRVVGWLYAVAWADA
jgi:hypothetical protein